MKTMRKSGVLALCALALTLSARAASAKPFDQAFIDAMTPHHQMANMMAQTVIRNGSLPEVKRLARGIIAEQSREIAQMKALRHRLYGSSQIPPVPGMMHSMKGSKQMMPGMMQGMDMTMTPGMMMGMPMKMRMDMGKLMTARGREADRLFLKMMIPHHASAVVMSDEALNTTGNAQIRALAAKIMDSNADEIGEMHDIYDRRFGDLAKSR